MGSLFQSLDQRRFLRFDNEKDLNSQLKDAFKHTEHVCRWYQDNTQSLIPPGLLLPRALHFDLEKPLNE